MVKHLFLSYYDSYIIRIEEEMKKPLKEFQAMPFEYGSNGMYGSYNYPHLKSRLETLRGRLEKETQTWRENGHILTKAESGWKYFKMLEELEKLKKISAELSAAPASKDNLFLWDASLYGPEGSLWNGGLYKLELVYDDTEAPPRVRFLNEMWHPHITKDGIPFLPLPLGTRDPVIPVLQAIQKLLQNKPNSSEATWVNKDAALQYFSKSEETQKEYKKKVNRCVRLSLES